MWKVVLQQATVILLPIIAVKPQQKLKSIEILDFLMQVFCLCQS
jgi:hypothetical protein